MSLREKKIAQKQKDILRSAAKILANKGYHGTTMEEIAANLLMTKGAMYYYFKNKEDLLYQCHQMVMDESLKRIQKIFNSTHTPDKKLSMAIKSHIELLTNEKSIFMVMDKPSQYFSGAHLEEITGLRRKYATYFDLILQDGIDQKIFSEFHVPTIRMIILGALNWIQQWYQTDGEKSSEEIAEIFSTYLLKMVKK